MAHIQQHDVIGGSVRFKVNLHWRDKEDAKVRLGEHKQVVKRGHLKTGIAVHAHESHHAIDWDSATIKRSVTGYWQRTTEAIHIRNMDSGLKLLTVGNPILNPP